MRYMCYENRFPLANLCWFGNQLATKLQQQMEEN